MGFPNGTLKGMPRMLEDGLADITTGPQPRNAVYFDKLHFSPIVVESMLTMLSGMKTAFVSRAQSFSSSFDNYVSPLPRFVIRDLVEYRAGKFSDLSRMLFSDVAVSPRVIHPRDISCGSPHRFRAAEAFAAFQVLRLRR